MFRIRRIYDNVLPVNKQAITEVRQIFVEHFPGAPRTDIDGLEEKFRNPFMQRFRMILYVAENSKGHVSGFAMVLMEPGLRFCYLDYLAVSGGTVGRGIGAALYEYVRDEAVAQGAKGLFFECLPDDPERCSDTTIRRQNIARLRFYECYGARPIVGTAYETPVPGGSSDNIPHLVFDGLDREKTLKAKYLQDVIRAVLERKYGTICPPEYVSKVVESIQKNPVELRTLRYTKQPVERPIAQPHGPEPMALVVHDRHGIHHIKERGYVESPVRISVIASELTESGLFENVPPKEYPIKHIQATHDPDLVDFLKRACAGTPEGKSVYPYIFPIRNRARPPKDLSIRAGYYCIDTFTPINNNAYPAAIRGVDCALTAADEILRGRRTAYALVRPPGHHAERASFGGFCYFNNAAIAAQYLCQFGTVAILDIDYHHGNGQQDIFYHRPDVLTVSIHGDPDFAYPYFTGFADEIGTGPGTGFNINIALPEIQDGPQYRIALATAMRHIQQFSPSFLIVALGLDPAKGDPTGTWSLGSKDFEENGRLLSSLNLPTLIIQEGGYRTRTLGKNARAFFQGFATENAKK